MGGLTFGAPGLSALIPIVVALGAMSLWAYRAQEKRMSTWIRREHWKVVLPGYRPGHATRRGLLLTGAVLLGLFALMRPRYGLEATPHAAKSLDIVVVLDLSNSMNAEDVVPSRLRVAKRAVDALLKALPGDRFGLVGFAGVPQVLSPLTNDLEYVGEVLQSVDPSDLRPQGSDVGAALIVARDLQAAASEHPQGRVVILVTDGEDHEGTFREAAQKLKAAASISAVVAVGTERGAPVPQRDGAGRLSGYVKDSGGNTVVTRIGTRTLKSVADATGGPMFNLADGERAVDGLIDYLRKAERGELAVGAQPVYRERYQVPLALALLLLAWEVIGLARLRTLVLAFLLGASGVVQAEERAGSLGAYQRNREALSKLKNQDPKTAADLFGEARALDPDSRVLPYNQGVSRYQSGDFERSLEAAEDAQTKADAGNDPDLFASSAYNRGAALEKLGKSEEAARAYLEGLRRADEAQLSDLSKKLRKKLEQVQQQKQQQKQQQGQQQEKDQQGEGQGGQQQTQSQQSQGRRFRSDQLTREDAERIMKELANREQGLKQKLGKPKRSGSDPKNGPEKDW